MSDFSIFLQHELNNLPPLPKSVQRIKQLCCDPESAIIELKEVVESDPLLTANLLRLANSAYYGFSGQINNVFHAITIFGKSTVLGFALASAIRNSFVIDLSAYGITPEQMSMMAQLRSSLIFSWFRRFQTSRKELLIPAAFLDGIGKILIAKYLQRHELNENFCRRIKSGEQLFELENEFVGMCQEKVTADLLLNWSIDSNMAELIRRSCIDMQQLQSDDTNIIAMRVVKLSIAQNGILDSAGIQMARTLIEESDLALKDFDLALQTMQGEDQLS